MLHPYFAKWFGMSNGMYFAVILQSFGMFCSQFLNMKFTYEFKADKNLILSVFISLTSVIIALVMIQILPSDINYWSKITGTLVVYALVSVVACIYIFSKGKPSMLRNSGCTVCLYRYLLYSIICRDLF